MAATVMTVMGLSSAFAQSANVQNIKYIFHQNDIYNPAFDFAWKAMAPVYKGSLYDRSQPNPDHPLIGIGEVDLNGDDLPELVTFPTEEDEQVGQFCRGQNGTCPFYILEVRGKDVHTLGVVNASSIDRGDKIQNGYWTLKVFTDEWAKPPGNHFDVYVYDKKIDGYTKQAP